MSKIKLVAFFTLLSAIATTAFADDMEQTRQNIERDQQLVTTDNQALNDDDNAIHELDRERNEALRVKNFPLAAKLQTAIDQKRAQRNKSEQELKQAQDRLNHQKHDEKEECEHDTQCAEAMKKRELTRQLEEARSKLAADEAAAARVGADKDAVAHIEEELNK